VSTEPIAPLHLFCLPHGGGNALHFHAWAHWVPEGVTVTPVDLPGHGTRLRERLHDQWPALIDDLVAQVGDRVDGPYALFGHSLGALVAFDIARRMTDSGHPPAVLIAAGRNAPGVPPSHRPIHQLPDGPFLNALVKLGGTPAAIRHQPELLDMYLPVLRADLRLAELYQRPPGADLRCPVLALIGRRDPMTDVHGLAAWQRETTATCELAVLDGPHFFLDEPEFREVVHARLARLTAAPRTYTGNGRRP